MNAPVPPTSEMDSQKISSQYQSSYGQGYSTQANLPAEQQEMPQEALQSGMRFSAKVVPFYSFNSVRYYIRIWFLCMCNVTCREIKYLTISYLI